MSEPEPLVLLPGLQSDRRSWFHQLRFFDGRRPVVVPHGHQFCASLPAMAESVLPQLPDRFHLAAWSMGGYITFQLLPAIADRLISLILVSTTALPESAESTRRRLDLIAEAEQDGIAAAARRSMAHSCRDVARLDPEARAAVLQGWSDLGIDAYRGQQRAIIDRPDGRPHLSLVRCPTMIIAGEADAVIPLAATEDIRRHVPAAKMVVLPDCGHCPPLEYPERVNALMERWLAGAATGEPELTSAAS